MVFAIETYCPATDGYSAARIEEEVVVTDKGCRLISLFPAEELPISGEVLSRNNATMGPAQSGAHFIRGFLMTFETVVPRDAPQARLPTGAGAGAVARISRPLSGLRRGPHVPRLS